MTSEKVKIYKVIFSGHLLITVPILTICFGLPYYSFHLTDNIYLKLFLVLISVIIGFTISWILWSFLITKWKIWAFNKIKEEHWISLYELSVKNKLIWELDNPVEYTELRSEEEKIKIQRISEKIEVLLEIDQIKIDLKTPEKVLYKYNRFELIIEIISKLLFLSALTILLSVTDKTALKVISFLGILIFLYLIRGTRLHPIFTKKDGIILSSEGIYIEELNNNIIQWDEINSLDIDIDGRKMTILKYELDSTKEFEIELWRYKISNYLEFRKMVDVFIDRNKRTLR